MKIFVYGTLKRGMCRGGVLSGQTFLGDAITKPNYTLYDCGSYPALVEVEEGKPIEGEVWEVTASCVSRLDMIEGAPTLYRREPVKLEGDKYEGVVTYLYQQSTRNFSECGTCWNDK